MVEPGEEIVHGSSAELAATPQGIVRLDGGALGA
jgi:hypothetical protein